MHQRQPRGTGTSTSFARLLQKNAVGLVFLLEVGMLLDFGDENLECLLNILVVLGRTLDERTAQFIRAGLTFLSCDLSVFNSQIGLVSNENSWHLFGSAGVQDLVVENSDEIERGLGSHRVDQHVAMNADRILSMEDGVLVLSRGVQNLGIVFLALVLDDLVEGVFDGGVVRIYEMVLNISYGYRGFADTTKTHDRDFALLRRHFCVGSKIVTRKDNETSAR